MDRTAQTGRRATMHDVAAAAGVSLKTVSRVVNEERYVSDDVVARVRQAIASVGYRPDGRARRLRSAQPSVRPQAGLIGFVQVDASNPFFAAAYRGLEDQTLRHAYLVVAGSTDAEQSREGALLETLVELRVDGLVVAAGEGNDEILRQEIELGTAVVCIDRRLPQVECDTVVSSNRAGMREAVAHLIQRGHRRIAFIGGRQDVWTGSERRAGYLEALSAAALPADEDLQVLGVDEPGRAAAAAQSLLSSARSPTAIVAAQDRVAVGVVAALQRLRRQHDVALIGFDELSFSKLVSPTITVVAQDPYQMGRRAGELLLDRLVDGSTAPARHVVIDTRMIHRQSGDIPPKELSAGSHRSSPLGPGGRQRTS